MTAPKPAFPPATIAAIVRAIPPGQPITAREIELLLPHHYCRGTIRAVLRFLALEGRVEVEDLSCARYALKRYRLCEGLP